MAKLTLTPRGIYAWTMYPGYGDEPYRSPIQVIEVTPSGGRLYELDFVNMFYAVGVQKMKYSLRTLRRENSYLVAEQVTNGRPTERVIIIEKMTRKWVRHFIPNSERNSQQFFDATGEPIPDAFTALTTGQ